MFLIFSFYIMSCDPEGPTGTCSLDIFDGKSYSGVVMLCNALPGQQLDFLGSAVMTISDTLLLFDIESKNSNISFNYSVSVKDECVEREKNIFTHVLHSIEDNSIVGNIGVDGTSLFIYIKNDTCSTPSIFSGTIK